MLKQFFFVLIALVACNSTAQEIQRLSVSEFEELMKSKELQLVDVRTPGEVARGIIPGAQHIDWNGEGFEELVLKLDKDSPIAVYCAAGGRSARAASKLKSLGFKEIYDLKPGFTGWQAEGKEIQE